MSSTLSKAEFEFDMLEKTVEDAIVVPSRKEILALFDGTKASHNEQI